MIWVQASVLLAVILCVSLGISFFIEWLESRADLGEGCLTRRLGIDFQREMSGGEYLWTLLGLSTLAGAVVFAVASLQGLLPLNPEHFQNLPLLKALHLAVAVATHTNLQPFSPELDLTPFTQTFAVAAGNLLIGGVCVAGWRAIVHALARKPLGNAYAGVWRGLLILAPLQIILALILVSQGVPQNLLGAKVVGGGVASFISGGLVSGAGAGWMGDSFASAVENPTLLSDLASLTLLVAVPLGFCYATGTLLKRQALMNRLVIALLLTLGAFTLLTQLGNPNALDNPRWGLSQSLWFNATAGSANGTVNTPIENFNPAGRLPPFLLLLAGIPFPPPVALGVGTLLLYLLIAIYLSALMVGRSPDFLGFKVRIAEVALTAAGVLGPQLVVLVAAGALVFSPVGQTLLAQQGAYGLSALLWMLGSCAQNNGSAFSLTLTDPALLKAGIAVMLTGRVLTLGAVVLVAARFARQRTEPTIAEAVDSAHPLVVAFWLTVVLVGGALAMLPLIGLGPLLEVLR